VIGSQNQFAFFVCPQALKGRCFPARRERFRASLYTPSFPPRTERVLEYIANQEVHHQRATFQEELIALLEKHGVAYDERYLFA
jgi:hypothetical protein